MRKPTERKMNLIVLAILAVIVAGGIGVVVRRFTSHQDLLQKGHLTLQTSLAPGIILCNVRTCAHRHEFVVTGHLQNTDEHNVGRQGAITVAILSPQGVMLDHRSDRYVLSPSYKPAGVHFEERFGTIPPTGSVLRIEWDRAEQAPRQPPSRGMTIPITNLVIDGETVEMVALPLIFQQSRKNGLGLDEAAAQTLYKTVRIYNPIPQEREQVFREAILRKHRSFREENKP